MCTRTLDQLAQLVPEETFKAWKRIQHEGSINMLEAGAKYPDLFSPEVFSAILDNYSTLDAHYTDKEGPPRGSHDVVEKPSATRQSEDRSKNRASTETSGTLRLCRPLQPITSPQKA